MPIKEADKSYEHKKLEKKIQKFWKDEDTFSKVNKLRENGPRYSFLDGPPYCSGRIHLGTAWNKTIKDTLDLPNLPCSSFFNIRWTSY